MSGNESVMRHKGVTEELNALYERKNHDYGDSFHLTWEKFGAVMAAIRLEDKLQRFETLIRSESKVQDESIRDTLMDLANYSIMSVMELDREAEARRTEIAEGIAITLSAFDERHVCGNCGFGRTDSATKYRQCFSEPATVVKVHEADTCDRWIPKG